LHARHTRQRDPGQPPGSPTAHPTP
jgi:hypothetical protein